MSPFNIGDYFQCTDILHHGETVWNKIRQLVRDDGFNISKCYGSWAKITQLMNPQDYIVILQFDKDLVIVSKSAKSPMRRQLRVDGVVIHTPVKMRITRSDGGTTAYECMRMMCEHLMSLGFKLADNLTLEQYAARAHQAVGIIGNSVGDIRVISNPATFDKTYHDVDEILYDIKRIVALANVRVKPRMVEVQGQMVCEEALKAFLLSMKEAGHPNQ